MVPVCDDVPMGTDPAAGHGNCISLTNSARILLVSKNENPMRKILGASCFAGALKRGVSLGIGTR